MYKIAKSLAYGYRLKNTPSQILGQRKQEREREPVKAMEKCPYVTDMGTMAMVHT